MKDDDSIAWLPTGVTSYYMDSTKLAGPTKYASKNPSVVIINNWSNGDCTSYRVASLLGSVRGTRADSLISYSRLHPGPSSQGLDHAE
jgi:hypothetical protein